MMQWQQVRELFPDQFVLLSIIDFHEEADRKVITEVAPIRAVAEQEANREFSTQRLDILCIIPPMRSVSFICAEIL